MQCKPCVFSLDVQANGYRSPSEARWGSTRSTTWTKPWTSSLARESSWSPLELRVSATPIHMIGLQCSGQNESYYWLQMWRIGHQPTTTTALLLDCLHTPCFTTVHTLLFTLLVGGRDDIFPAIVKCYNDCKTMKQDAPSGCRMRHWYSQALNHHCNKTVINSSLMLLYQVLGLNVTT